MNKCKLNGKSYLIMHQVLMNTCVISKNHIGKPLRKKPKKKAIIRTKMVSGVKLDDYGFNEQTGGFEPGYGDGHEVQVRWFKLDEEYPDLADKTEALAEKYQVGYSDSLGGVKAKVYENADRLSNASEEHLENLFMIKNYLVIALKN